MAITIAEYFEWVKQSEESLRKSAGYLPLDAKCDENFEKHMVTGHKGQKIRCYSCQGTDRAPIPWAEVMQHG